MTNKIVKIALVGDGSCGKTTAIKAMQAIHFMKRMGMSRDSYFENENFMKIIEDKQKGIVELSDAFGFQWVDRNDPHAVKKINEPKVEDFVNIEKIQQDIQANPDLNKHFEVDGLGNLKIRKRLQKLDISFGATEKPATLYEDLIKYCPDILEKNGVSLQDIVMNTTKTEMRAGEDIKRDRVWVELENEWVEVYIKDMGGQDTFKYIRVGYHEDVDSEIAFFDVTDFETLKNIGKFPNTFNFPTYDELDIINLAVILKFIKEYDKETFNKFVDAIPQNQELSELLEIPSNPTEKQYEESKKFVQSLFKKDFYEKTLEDSEFYDSTGTYGWLREIYNTKFLYKQTKQDLVMVPVLVYGNKGDMMREKLIRTEQIVEKIEEYGGDYGLPYLIGSAQRLENIEPMFKTITLMALSSSKRIGEDNYNKQMEKLDKQIFGKHSLWYRKANA